MYIHTYLRNGGKATALSSYSISNSSLLLPEIEGFPRWFQGIMSKKGMNPFLVDIDTIGC